MLDTETKSKIDTARDILVGKIPNPQAQVEQITIAMIYKFMDDMDLQVEEAGGKRKFFSGNYSSFSWQHLMSPKLGGLEVLNLYSEAIQKMDLNPNIPPLFRDIFKNAYLPYKDPETLRSFLKTINGFNYDHSERLGDAFEYLLSILGSQGDAGQFRTPRHIIDFMVYITNPLKDETILDPACGTAGFLISSFKHILKNNSSEYLKKKDYSFTFGNGPHFSGDKLTPDDRRKLPKNIRGYDISPDMVRLSLVNLYLHGFAEPNIFEYDTLTSEDKWNEYYNVILANPPFMSPKGGIRPHKKFSIESSRSEVLFVDYIAEHLTQFGRAAIIVPEGIIFQSGTVYKSLRKMLVEKCLYGVVSLPAGVFNPYSGVKTSILLLDKQLAQKTDNILFIKIENDGFDLGAQRRPIDKNDLPASAKAIKEYKESLITGKNFRIEDYPNLLLAPKSKISETGDYNLSGERYKEVISYKSSFPLVKLSDILTLEYGKPLKSEDRIKGDIPVFGSNGIVGYHNSYLIEGPAIIVGRKGTAGAVNYSEKPCYPIDTTFFVKLTDKTKIDIKYCYYQLRQLGLDKVNVQAGVPGLNRLDAYRKKIPLPPIEVQREIVQEIESYQKIIDAARQIVDNYKPRINIDPKWEVVELGDLIKVSSGRGLTQANMKIGNYPVYGGNGINGYHSEYFLEQPTIVIGRVGAYCGVVHVTEPKSWITDNGLYVTEFLKDVNQNFLAIIISEKNLNQYSKVGGQPSISQQTVYRLKIPLPSLEVQKEIVEQIEREQSIVNANKELIKIFEEKIKSKISSVWGEEK